MEHLRLMNLHKLAKSLGIVEYLRILGYAREAVKIKLVLDTLSRKMWLEKKLSEGLLRWGL